jgi:hypothetical protein
MLIDLPVRIVSVIFLFAVGKGKKRITNKDKRKLFPSIVDLEIHK